MDDIRFNKPYLSGKELSYISTSIQKGRISGNHEFTKKCHKFFNAKYDFKKVLFTTSCTDALEMSSLLMDIKPGDEIIVPSYTFVSTANAFALRGAKLVFADSSVNNPNIDASKIENLITNKTKAIVVVHYAGVACEMDMIMELAKKFNLFVVEDAAQAIDSYYKDRPLGGIGHFGAFSFHETKNIICGEGGLIAINQEKFSNRAEILWEKGTNRAAFYRGEVDKYGWVDVGSSFLASDILAAFLYAQLENLEEIQTKRISIWNHYYKSLLLLQEKEHIKLPQIPEFATQNGHLFFILCKTLKERTALISYLRKNKINAVFHYLSLHKSKFFKENYFGSELPNCDKYSDTLLRLPLYYELSKKSQNKVIACIYEFYKNSLCLKSS